VASARHPLERTLGHTFATPALLEEALRHRGALGVKSAAGEVSNERLEFLGDRVLGLILADMLLKAFPTEDEGALAQRFAALASAPTLDVIAGTIKLADHVKVAPGQRADEADTAVLPDALEALIGAIFLDGGLDSARTFVVAQWEPLLKTAITPPKDAKTALQEWAQARGLPLPVYDVVAESGPAHAPHFEMTVTVQGHPPAQGKGRTKRLATQAAAAALLNTLPKDKA
jgi:ribonuclease-3